MRPGSVSEGNNAWTQPGDFAWQVRTRQGGYDMEITIPAERIRPAWTPPGGASLRFDAYVNDRARPGQSTPRPGPPGGGKLCFWVGGCSGQPSSAGKSTPRE